MPPPQQIPFSDSTDSRLLRRAEKREPKAWAQLIDVYGPLVYAWCRQSRLQPADAADVVQEVFAALIDALAKYEKQEHSSFRAWLRAITGHKIVDHLRRIQHRPRSIGGTSAAERFVQLPTPEEVIPEEPAPLSARATLVQRALEQLREEVQDHTWQAFWRTTMEEQAAADVASALGMKAGAVYQAKSRTLVRLREIVCALDAREREG